MSSLSNSEYLRQKVLAEAETWIGTPYEHMQRCKGAGADCGQFPLGVYYNAGIIPYVTTEYYPKDFHLHRDREWYKELVERFADEISESVLLPADFVLYREGRVFSHGGIVVSWPRIIHSYVGHGVQFADGLQGHYGNRPKRFYRPKAFLSE